MDYELKLDPELSRLSDKEMANVAKSVLKPGVRTLWWELFPHWIARAKELNKNFWPSPNGHYWCTKFLKVKAEYTGPNGALSYVTL